MKNEHPKNHHGGSAFLWGLIIGALLASLLTTKRGRRILRELSEVAMDLIENFIEEKTSVKTKPIDIPVPKSKVEQEKDEVEEDLESEVTEVESESQKLEEEIQEFTKEDEDVEVVPKEENIELQKTAIKKEKAFPRD